MTGIDGTTAVVTGGGRGIGRDICLALARGGADVAVLDIDLDGALETAGLVEEAGRGSLAARCDIADRGDVQRRVADVLAWRGQVHALVNNAGITRDGLLLRMSDEDWDNVLRVNLTGTFNMTRAVARHMFKMRRGRIVNIASVIGQMGNAGQSNYAASKAGVIGFTKAVARELAPRGVTVNAIAPGFIETAMTASLSEEVRERMRGMIPLGRFGTGADVAGAVMFLVSDLGAYVTGQVINCDGGMIMAR